MRYGSSILGIKLKKKKRHNLLCMSLLKSSNYFFKCPDWLEIEVEVTSYQKLSDPDKCRKKEGFLINLIGNLFLSCCNEIPSRCFSKSRILVAAITVSKRKLSYNEVKSTALVGI